MSLYHRYWRNRWRPRSIYLIFLISIVLWKCVDRQWAPERIRRFVLKWLKRSNRELAIIDQSIERTPPRGFPTTMIVSATFRCNLRCIQCWTTSLPAEKRKEFHLYSMSIELFRKIAKEMFPYLQTINPGLSGEPFLIPYFDEIVETCARYGVRLDFITNGTLLNEKRLNQIYPVLSEIRISIDGASKELLEEIRVGTKYDQLMENLRRYQSYRKERKGYRPIFGGCSVIMERNLHELPALLDLAVDLEMDYMEYNYMLAHNKGMIKELPIYHIKKVNKVLEDLKKRAENLPIRLIIPPLLPTLDTEEQGSREIPFSERETCRFLWNYMSIDPIGVVWPCCEPRAPILGNANENTLTEIWRGDIANKVRRTHKGPDAEEGCRVCCFYRVLPRTLKELEKTYIKLADE